MNTQTHGGARRFLLLLLVCLMLIGSAGCRGGSDVPLSAGLVMIEGVPVYDEDVALKTDHFTLTPGMMAYFFYTYGATVLSGLEAQKPFDESKSLHGQMYNETQSFYDVIMSETLSHVCYMLICCEAAYAENVTLSEAERTQLEATVSSYRTQGAAEYGMQLEAYLQALYGPLMTEQDLRAVLELEALASSFSATVSERLEAQITALQIEDYMKEKGIEDDTPSRNLAFLYLPFENGAPATQKIADVMGAMQSVPTPATLQKAEHGTYGEQEHMTPDNSGIAQITAWLFDEARKVGDWGRVDVGGATYILIYTDNGMSYGEVQARSALFDLAFATWRNGWVESLVFGYNYDCLDSYDFD